MMCVVQALAYNDEGIDFKAEKSEGEAMKPPFAFLCPVLLLLCGTVVAQGSLEPDGPPGEIMKSLDQVEPRTPVQGPGPLTISNPGSYYLTEDIVGNVTIDADNVTLDLNGFTISSGNPVVNVTDQTNVRIHNGRIQNGSNVGIAVSSSNLVYISDLQMTGFFACITALQISGYVEIMRVDCDSTQGEGLRLLSSAEQVSHFRVVDCTFTNTSQDMGDPRAAISIRHLGTGSITAEVTGNRIMTTLSDGIFTLSPSASSAGIVADNYVFNAGTGFDISGDFVVTGNVASSNAINYDFAGAPNAAPVVAIGSGPAPWDNVSD